MGEDIFVPKIFALDQWDKLCTGIAWLDCIPALIPEVDCIIIPRQQLAPGLFSKKEDMVMVKWEVVEDILKTFPKEENIFPYYKLKYAQYPQSILKFIKKQRPLKEKLTGVAWDVILNREIIDKIRKNNHN